MRAVQMTRPKGPLQLVEREIPDPGPGTVRIKDERQSPVPRRPDHWELKGRAPAIMFDDEEDR
jgi:NADPH:quinone reductase-like Zn-dependent oxidoreductase